MIDELIPNLIYPLPLVIIAIILIGWVLKENRAENRKAYSPNVKAIFGIIAAIDFVVLSFVMDFGFQNGILISMPFVTPWWAYIPWIPWAMLSVVIGRGKKIE